MFVERWPTLDEAKAAINRAQGSIAFVAAARSVLAIVADKRDATGRRRLLRQHGLRYVRIGMSKQQYERNGSELN